MDKNSFSVGCVVRGGELGGSEEITPVIRGDIGLTLVELRRGTDARTQSIAVVLAEKSSYVGLTRGDNVWEISVIDGTDVAHLDCTVEKGIHPDVVLL